MRHPTAYLLLISCLGLAALPTGAGAKTAAPDDVLSPEFRANLRAAARQVADFDDRFHAQVWLLDMSNRLGRYVADPQKRMKILETVYRQAQRNGLNPQIVLSVMTVESHFRRFAISSAGARGLMQVMPFWKEVIGRRDDNLLTIRTNIRYGTAILARYLQVENGNMAHALARYHGSVGSYYYPNLVYEALREQWSVR